MIYYTDELKKRVARVDLEDGTSETYDFTLGRWHDDTELWDMLIGKLWLDTINQDEAEAIIQKRDKALHR